LPSSIGEVNVRTTVFPTTVRVEAVWLSLPYFRTNALAAAEVALKVSL
jgi:hypothetical protein